MTRRIEITVSEETWDRLNVARGHEPRASFVKRALESALGPQTKAPELREPNGGNASSAPTRASVPPAPVQAVVRPGTPYAPKLPPGVRTARELASERQAALNKAKGS